MTDDAEEQAEQDLEPSTGGIASRAVEGIKRVIGEDAGTPKAFEVDEDLYNAIRDGLGEGKVIKVKPYPENEGMEASEGLLEELWDLRLALAGLRNVSPVMSFEIWYTEGTIKFLFWVPTKAMEAKLKQQLNAYYHDAKIVDLGDSMTEEEDTTPFPEVRKDDFASGAELYLRHDARYPIKNPYGVRDFNFDPYRGLTSSMNVDIESRIVIQVVFKPTRGRWASGGLLHALNPLAEDAESIADDLRGDITQADLLNPGANNRRAISEEKQLSNRIAMQKDMDAFSTNIRILAFSPEEMTSDYVWQLGSHFVQKYKEAGDQTFIQVPATNRSQLKKVMNRAAARRHLDNGIYLTIPELTSVAHIPNESIETSDVEWNPTEKGSRLPADAERFLDGLREETGAFDPGVTPGEEDLPPGEMDDAPDPQQQMGPQTPDGPQEPEVPFESGPEEVNAANTTPEQPQTTPSATKDGGILAKISSITSLFSSSGSEEDPQTATANASIPRATDGGGQPVGEREQENQPIQNRPQQEHHTEAEYPNERSNDK